MASLKKTFLFSFNSMWPAHCFELSLWHTKESLLIISVILLLPSQAFNESFLNGQLPQGAFWQGKFIFISHPSSSTFMIDLSGKASLKYRSFFNPYKNLNSDNKKHEESQVYKAAYFLQLNAA